MTGQIFRIDILAAYATAQQRYEQYGDKVIGAWATVEIGQRV